MWGYGCAAAKRTQNAADNWRHTEAGACQAPRAHLHHAGLGAVDAHSCRRKTRKAVMGKGSERGGGLLPPQRRAGRGAALGWAVAPASRNLCRRPNMHNRDKPVLQARHRRRRSAWARMAISSRLTHQPPWSCRLSAAWVSCVPQVRCGKPRAASRHSWCSPRGLPWCSVAAAAPLSDFEGGMCYTKVPSALMGGLCTEAASSAGVPSRPMSWSLRILDDRRPKCLWRV